MCNSFIAAPPIPPDRRGRLPLSTIGRRIGTNVVLTSFLARKACDNDAITGPVLSRATKRPCSSTPGRRSTVAAPRARFSLPVTGGRERGRRERGRGKGKGDGENVRAALGWREHELGNTPRARLCRRIARENSTAGRNERRAQRRIKFQGATLKDRKGIVREGARLGDERADHGTMVQGHGVRP